MLYLQTCRAFRDASKHDAVWEAKAKERFPPETAHLGDTYSTWRALTADDNAAHASLVLPLKQISSDYKHNRPDYFFECCIMDLQLNRATGALRVFFDARGEADLRNPLTASLGVTVHRAHTNRRELRSILAQLSQRRTELLEEADRLEPLITQDPEAANLHHRTLRELHLAMLRTVRAHQELQEAPYIGFADLLTVLRPSKHEFFVQKPGHFKGYLEFENIAQIEALADSLPHSYRLKHEVERCGVDLVFCYANPVPVMPHVSRARAGRAWRECALLVAWGWSPTLNLLLILRQPPGVKHSSNVRNLSRPHSPACHPHAAPYGGLPPCPID